MHRIDRPNPHIASSVRPFVRPFARLRDARAFALAVAARPPSAAGRPESRMDAAMHPASSPRALVTRPREPRKREPRKREPSTRENTNARVRSVDRVARHDGVGRAWIRDDDEHGRATRLSRCARERRARVRARARRSTWDGGARGYGRRREREVRGREEEEEDCDVYTVRYGDTLVGVARTHGTSVDAICEANGVRLASEDETPALFVAPAVVDTARGEGDEGLRVRRRRTGGGGTRRATALSAKERDAEYARARRVRSERKRATAPATETHAVVSGSAVETLTRDEASRAVDEQSEAVTCSWWRRRIVDGVMTCNRRGRRWASVMRTIPRYACVDCDARAMSSSSLRPSISRAKTFPTMGRARRGKGRCIDMRARGSEASRRCLNSRKKPRGARVRRSTLIIAKLWTPRRFAATTAAADSARRQAVVRRPSPAPRTKTNPCANSPMQSETRSG